MMVKKLTIEEYNRMMGLQPPPVQGVMEGDAPSTNGAAIELHENFAGYTKKFIKHDWQTIDIIHLLRYMDREGPNVGCANWSEMGAMKTSTGLWLLERKIN